MNHRGLTVRRLSIAAVAVLVLIGTWQSPAQAEPKNVVMVLENTGPAEFGAAGLIFDSGVRVGDSGSPSNVDYFRLNARPISRDNPQLPGKVSCTRAVALEADDALNHAEVQNANGTGVSFNYSPPITIVPDETVVPFDYWAFEVHFTGSFRFLTPETFRSSKLRCR